MIASSNGSAGGGRGLLMGLRVLTALLRWSKWAGLPLQDLESGRDIERERERQMNKNVQLEAAGLPWIRGRG